MLPTLFFLIAFFSEVVGTIAGLRFFGVVCSARRPAPRFSRGPGASILHVFSNAAKLVFFGRHVRLRVLLLIGIPSVCFVILGAYLSTRLEFKFTELLLGLFLIALVFSSSSNRR
jgi:uncharacterized protein